MMRTPSVPAGAIALAAIVFAGGCTQGPQPDAYGNVETTEVVVGSQAAGQLLWFTPVEGSALRRDSVVGVVDTTQLALQRRQTQAQRAASASQQEQVSGQLAALEVQRDIARRNYERIERLFSEQAATAQQRDQAEQDYKVAVANIEATTAQRAAMGHDVMSSQQRMAQLNDQIRKSLVVNPIGGTVLATYAKAGEVVQPGQPLYRIANLDSMDVRAYVSESQLARVRIGSRALVGVDVGSGHREVAGTVTWVSSQAEFTPTPIQTKDERQNLVYAFKIRVPNRDGLFKIGMPVDVRLSARAAT